MQRFLSAALARAGAEELVTPREIIRDFLMLLNILQSNPNENFDTLMAADTASREATPEKSEKRDVDLSDFEF